jgi:flagellar biosynthesis anti-sigma factor FlgM
MKINGPPTRANVNQVHDKAQVKSNEPNKPAGSASAHVEVSSLSRTLAEARTQPEAPDQAKIAELRHSINAGSFQVNHEQVADTMVREEV